MVVERSTILNIYRLLQSERLLKFHLRARKIKQVTLKNSNSSDGDKSVSRETWPD